MGLYRECKGFYRNCIGVCRELEINIENTYFEVRSPIILLNPSGLK